MPPRRIAVCGTLSAAWRTSPTVGVISLTGVSSALFWQSAEHFVERVGGLLAVDGADDDDVQIVARHGAGVEGLEVLGGELGDALRQCPRRASRRDGP